MDSSVLAAFTTDRLVFLGLTALVAIVSSFLVFVLCFAWFRRYENRAQKRHLRSLHREGRENGELFLTGRDASACGELVAQFKVNQGKQVVSILESDGRRFVHIDGDLPASQRARMFRYLKSEGFMS